jgi:hypothetical protein
MVPSPFRAERHAMHSRGTCRERETVPDTMKFLIDNNPINIASSNASVTPLGLTFGGMTGPGGANAEAEMNLYVFSQVPEPSTALLVGVGLLALLGALRRN